MCAVNFVMFTRTWQCGVKLAVHGMAPYTKAVGSGSQNLWRGAEIFARLKGERECE